jgi:hypothetical protein
MRPRDPAGICRASLPFVPPQLRFSTAAPAYVLSNPMNETLAASAVFMEHMTQWHHPHDSSLRQRIKAHVSQNLGWPVPFATLQLQPPEEEFENLQQVRLHYVFYLSSCIRENQPSPSREHAPSLDLSAAGAEAVSVGRGECRQSGRLKSNTVGCNCQCIIPRACVAPFGRTRVDPDPMALSTTCSLCMPTASCCHPPSTRRSFRTF